MAAQLLGSSRRHGLALAACALLGLPLVRADVEENDYDYDYDYAAQDQQNATSTTEQPGVPQVATACDFDNEPVGVGYIWDPTCITQGGLGCNADGKSAACRLCGGALNATVPCPPSVCKFAQHPYIPYYWDDTCELGQLGCKADGIHTQCRFCGDFPYSTVQCPEGAEPPLEVACNFSSGAEPAIPVYWEPGCVLGMHGCNADGQHVQCRHCGEGEFEHIHCPGSQVCTGFGNVPTTPYFYDSSCTEGGEGCKADGVHVACRFCGAAGYEAVPCPQPPAPVDICRSTLGHRPTPYFWDESCEPGHLGCFADGVHAQCRFCGAGLYGNVSCPSAASGNLRGGNAQGGGAR